MILPAAVDYPVIAVGDLHGQAGWLAKLLANLRTHPVWPAARVVFLGDFVDRGPGVRDTVDLVLATLAEKPGSTAVLGNHDLALTRAAGLDGRPPSAYWRKRYLDAYDHEPTFRSYLGRDPEHGSEAAFAADLERLRDAVPAAHRDFLASLPWGASAAGHLFLHCGLSRDSDLSPEAQWACVERKLWSRATAALKFGSKCDRWFEPEYPAWVGADRTAALDPLPYPGKVQVTGHLYTKKPVADAAKVRIDTSGGMHEPLTACVLAAPDAAPEFVTSNAECGMRNAE